MNTHSVTYLFEKLYGMLKSILSPSSRLGLLLFLIVLLRSIGFYILRVFLYSGPWTLVSADADLSALVSVWQFALLVRTPVILNK